MGLVKVPEVDQRIVSVGLVSAETSRGISGFAYSDVRERYISEPRCRDKAACGARVKALAEPTDVVAPPAADVVDEGSSWLL